ncbi:MAG: M24 family metallopeptidase [Nevskiaceae bacterium]|nr:MAG: M24 family metallopeptidase [Nevskiaceae bacterium]TBR71804.1 MAG: M24 family metallopeptidase [Nevskiaceae bacterium]
MADQALDLSAFRDVQRLAYQCAETIAAELKPGMTEREVAAQMKDWLLARGVNDWFHQPFAWFGERTAFRGFVGFRHLGGFNPAFYPTWKRLEPGMAFILDVAPSLNGISADIGYSGALGGNAIVDRIMDDLLDYRELILGMVRERRHLSEVSQAVDRLCARQGYEPRHKAYPFEVLAHRVEMLKPDEKAHTSVMHFGLRNLTALGRDMLRGKREGWSPLWSSNAASDHPPTPGLWAVEPHLGFRGITGAKFEELLLVTKDGARWLDDDVPHVRRWMERGLWPVKKSQAA